MTRALRAADLGATLYMPATRSDLAAALLGGRLPGLRSAVICLEDAVAEACVPQALANLGALLRALMTAPATARPAVFVRPRSPDMLAQVCRLPGAELLDGYVLAKIGPAVLAHAIRVLPSEARLLPTLETAAVFDPVSVRRLRRGLDGVQERVLTVRIGGADLLQLMGARRSRVRTAYDGPLGPVIASLVGAFAPAGFALSAPVFEGLAQPALLREEVERDLEHGLITKTAIHPAQVPAIQAAYAVPVEDHAAAAAIVRGEEAVFASAGVMCEPATHGRWARSVLLRAERFGLQEVSARRVHVV